MKLLFSLTLCLFLLPLHAAAVMSYLCNPYKTSIYANRNPVLSPVLFCHRQNAPVIYRIMLQ